MPKIFVVDDEIEVCDSRKEFLSKEGYEVTTVTNGEEAVALLGSGKNKPDLMLLDIRMSGISGMDVLHRAKDIDQDIKVIMISALEDDVLMHYAMESGAMDYIVKPFTSDYLNKILAGKLSEIFNKKNSLS